MSAIDPKGDQKYWINGDTFNGVRYEPTIVGQEKYYAEGLTEENLMPNQNFDTGKFFIIFE